MQAASFSDQLGDSSFAWYYRRHMPGRNMEVDAISAAIGYQEVCGESLDLFTDFNRTIQARNRDAQARFFVSLNEYLLDLHQTPGSVGDFTTGYRRYLAGEDGCPRGSPARTRIDVARRLRTIEIDPGLEAGLRRQVQTAIDALADAFGGGKLSGDEDVYFKIVTFCRRGTIYIKKLAYKLLSLIDLNPDSGTYLRGPERFRGFLSLLMEVSSSEIPQRLSSIWQDFIDRVAAVAAERDLNALRLHYLERALSHMLIFMSIFDEQSERRRLDTPAAVWDSFEERIKKVFRRLLFPLEDFFLAESMDVTIRIFPLSLDEAVEFFERILETSFAAKFRPEVRGPNRAVLPEMTLETDLNADLPVGNGEFSAYGSAVPYDPRRFFGRVSIESEIELIRVGR